ncbi:MAG: CHAT domain-containing protein, partial [Myxococcota bacterium]
AAEEYDVAIAADQRAIELAELFRDLQFDELDRMNFLNVVASNYYRLSGSLLARRDRSAADVELAFRTSEQMRARSLLERLQLSNVPPVDPANPLAVARRATLTEIGAIQRRLVEQKLPENERALALAELDQLEAQERQQRTELARENPAFARLRMPSPPSLAEVQSKAGPDEAIVVFQIADRVNRHGLPDGGSWVTVITREGTKVFTLPQRRVLSQQIPMVGGLIVRRDASAGPALARLYRDLLADAIDSLPPGVSRLTIVPDGMLYEVPFTALRETPDAAPLVTRFEVSLTPSVSSLLRWRASEGPRSTRILALALESGGPQSLFRAAGTLQTGLNLGALPRAEQEARSIAEIVEDTEVHTGASASERFLKETGLDGFGVLHFATHAVMDRDYPERSAVVLAAGAEDEDGLLQAREVVALPLDGQVVVLSACSGAAGQPLRGEGLMSLARAFLHAGAHSVIASRWPLADRDALLLFERLYHHINRGETLAGALRGAQLDRIRAGAPAAAWAGVVILGRADQVLRPRDSLAKVLRRAAEPRWLGVLAASFLAGFSLWMAWRRRPGRTRPR